VTTPEIDAHRDLFEANEQMRLVVDSIRDYAIFMLDETGRVATWNTGARLTKGYSAAEIIGKHIETFYTPEDREQGLPRRLLGEAVANGRVESEGWRVRKDGTHFWADVIITALRDSEGRLIGFAKVTRDLTERMRAEQERLRLTRVEAAVRIKDEFLSIASHELKTPLTALKLQLDSLRQQVDGMDPKLAKKVERAAQGADRLNNLVESLLDISRIETGHLTLNPERTDLSEVLARLVDGLGLTASKAACSLTFKSAGPCVGVWDRVRLEQVTSNLIANAIKYAAGKPIDVSLFRDGNDAVIAVSDHGPGLADDALGKLFDRFERAAPLRHYGGLGLGLYISREIASAHGGTIAAENLSSGGARFTVRLPVRDPTDRAVP
jgi:PAS domain S-box-containing protein